MPLLSAYLEEEEGLDISFVGNLDVTLSHDIFRLCRQTKVEIRFCIIDLSGTKRVFDSGLALLQLLYQRLKALGVMVVNLAEHPGIQNCIPTIMQAPQSTPKLIPALLVR